MGELAVFSYLRVRIQNVIIDMTIEKFAFVFFTILLFCSPISAQEDTSITSGQTTTHDTITTAKSSDLEKINDIRSQLEKENSTYNTPVAADKNLLRFIQKDNESALSPEAFYWINWVRDEASKFDNTVTFKDTVIPNPLFVPLVFKGGLFQKDLQLYDKDFFQKQFNKYPMYKPDTSLFAKEAYDIAFENLAYDNIRLNHPRYFHYSMRDLPNDKVEARVIKKVKYEPDLIKVNNDTNINDVDAPVKFIPERRYWTSHFESAVQFAQNYLTPNWYNGGTSTLNLNNRQYLAYNYNKDRVQITNEMEWKTNIYTAPKDTIHDYKIGEDVFRLHGNVGYKAFSKWYYTFDATFQTQLFSNFTENTQNKLAAFLSPMNINVGLGMKYDLNKTFPKDKHKKLTISINLAPISYTYMYSINKDIDLSRHGFKKNPDTGEYYRSLNQFGSTINSTATFQLNRNVSWYSRFYYFTNYNRVLSEFENRLNIAISRFFSTTISANLRFDDGVTKKADYDHYLQINELLSFGFNYKW